MNNDDLNNTQTDENTEKKENEEIDSSNDGADRQNIEKELEDLRALADKFEDSYKRALADYQNLQRRTQEERLNVITSANKNLILKLLPVLDTLMLAVKHFSDQGLSMTVDQFLKVLEEEGLKRVKTIGEKFNPVTMEAVDTKEGEDGIVLDELRAGFENIRPAQVVVGKKGEN